MMPFPVFTFVLAVVTIVAVHACSFTGTKTIEPIAFSSDAIAAGRSASGSLYRTNQLPSWIDFDKVAKAKNWASRNLPGLLVGAFYGLMGLLSVPDVANVLLFTNNTATPADVLMRYIATLAQTVVWYREEISLTTCQTLPHLPLFPPSCVQLDCSFCTSLHNVREVHVSAMNRAQAAGPSPFYNTAAFASWPITDAMWAAIALDLDASTLSQRHYTPNYVNYDAGTLPINQFAMAITQFAFIGYPVLNPESVFIYNSTDKDWENFLHLWAVIGYGIGIDDQYNICLKPNIMATREHFAAIHSKYYIPSLFNLDHDRKVLIEALLATNLTKYIPGFLGAPTLYRYLRDIIKIDATNMYNYMSPIDQGAETYFDSVTVPIQYAYPVVGLLQVGIYAAVQGAITLFYNVLYVTPWFWSQYVFYNGSSPVVIDRGTC